MRNRKATIVIVSTFVVIVVFQLLPWWLGNHDLNAVRNNQEPRFASVGPPVADGGSTNYNGFGYTVWNLHRLTNFGDGKRGRIVGQTLEFDLPIGILRNKQEVKIGEEWQW